MSARRRLIVTVGLFTALALVHTWPLASAPGTWCRNDNADAVLNQWTLAWIAHAIVTQPLTLFDANIFYPEPNSLAFSEHLILQSLLAVPLLWLGASVVFVYNLVWFMGLVLSGAATCHVLTRWTGSWSGGLIAGSTVAFSSYVLTNIPHLQVAHVEFLPLVLLALDDLLTRTRLADGLRLGVATALQMLCSGYLLVFTATALVASLAARANDWMTRSALRRVAPPLALGGLVTMLIVGPFLVPYWRARTDQGLVRSLEETARFSASPTDYLATAARLHYAWWSDRFYPAPETLFPGGLPLLLAMVAIGTGTAWRDRRARMLVITGMAGFVLSFGPGLAIYRWLFTGIPLLQGIRAPARFGVLVLFAVGGLAAYGMAAVVDILGRHVTVPRRALSALPLVALVLVNAELMRAPLTFVRFEGIPPAYDALATEEGAIVAEFPFPSAANFQMNASSMLSSTRHWQRLLNGYSGFVPSSYEQHARELSGFPDARALADLTRAGVTHVIVQTDRAPDMVRAVERDDTHFRLLAASKGVHIYRFRPGGAP